VRWIGLCVWLSAVALCSAPPEARKTAPKQQKKAKMSSTLVLRNPRGNVTLELSHPKYVPAGGKVDEIPYQLLVLRPSGAPAETIEDYRGSTEAVCPIGDEKKLWSPDGMYLVLLRMDGVEVRRKGQFERQYLGVLGIEEKDFVIFRTAPKKTATASNFQGWRPDRPHTMRIITGANREEDAEP
jgi:hypothetical protein